MTAARIKTAELAGAMLDYWVARAEGWEEDRTRDRQMRIKGIISCAFYSGGYSYAIVEPRPTSGMTVGLAPHWSPSTMWNVAGPIIEREGLCIEQFKGRKHSWQAFEFNSGHTYRGPTPLVAAMRAYVASKFGDEVEAIEGGRG